MLSVIDASNDDFIRTTEPRHTERVQEFWQAIYDAGDVYEGTYEGPYCIACEEFKLPAELLDGEGGVKLCPIHERPVETLSEVNYFFALSKYADRLLALYADDPDFVQPESARNEVISFVKQGLQDLSISRSTFDWGIAVPWDEKHVFYVWIDALLNYATAAGFGTDPERFARTWPADVQLVGKDILRFHAVIWPAMLMAAGVDVPQEGLRARLAAGRRTEDEQVQGDRDPPEPDRRHVRVRRLPLLLHPRRSRSAPTATSPGSTCPPSTPASWPTGSATWRRA